MSRNSIGEATFLHADKLMVPSPSMKVRAALWANVPNQQLILVPSIKILIILYIYSGNKLTLTCEEVCYETKNIIMC